MEKETQKILIIIGSQKKKMSWRKKYNFSLFWNKGEIL